MKNKLIKSIIVSTAVLGLSFITPVSNMLTNTTSTQTAHAATILSDGPWEKNGDGSEFTQQLHNGNEIYYSIAPDDKYMKYFQQSVANWNALGVIKLVQVNWGDPNSEVRMQYKTGDAPDDTDDDTNAQTTFDSNHTNVWANVTIYQPNNTHNSVIKQTVVDHEVGHALGFEHDHRKPNNGKRYKNFHLTMYAYQDDGMKFYKLGGIEQRNLVDHYHIQPTNGYLDTNC